MRRYTVNLSDFFSDHRQKVFLGRRQEWKHIACLLEHIRSVFNLNSHIYLTNGENVLFPEKEDLDVICESDQLIVHQWSCSNGTHQIGAKNGTANDKPRDSIVNQNGKRKRDPQDKLKPEQPPRKVDLSCSESDSDDDDDDDYDVLPKIFAKSETILQQDESIQEIPKPKRKRIRKRKSKKVEVNTSPKVVVKTYGKSKMPTIITENGSHTSHIRFDNDNDAIDEEEISVVKQKESYRNLNKTTVPRVIKAVLQPSVHIPLNEEIPSVPDYEDVSDINISDILNNTKKKRQSRNRKKTLEMKQELIDTNIARAVSPTWDTELNQAKEAFLSTYSGEEFWETLKEALEDFPNIAMPSVNDIIAYQIEAQSYLALVERADDGESDDKPALKLTMRKLNGVPTAQPVMLSATLDQLTGIRLVATYQP